MTLGYLYPRMMTSPNRINLIHIQRTRVCEWRVEKQEGRYVGWDCGGGLGAERVLGRTFVRVNRALASLPSHYLLYSDWIIYNQHQTFLNSFPLLYIHSSLHIKSSSISLQSTFAFYSPRYLTTICINLLRISLRGSATFIIFIFWV